MSTDMDYCTHEGQNYVWDEHDAQGIYLCRVCDLCVEANLSKYRPEMFTGYSQADIDEQIEPDGF